MKGFIYFLILIGFSSCSKSNDSNPSLPSDDSFTVTVNNGFGSGKYKTGDTVNIFSVNYGTNQLFDHWSGDVSLLNAAGEWHTWFIMPDRSVTLSGNLKNVISFTLQFTTVKGRDRLKPVFYYFPQNTKGIVYLLHGTGGKASIVAGDFEWQQLIKTLVDGGYGVIITEAEEATTQVDANGDGKLRWALLPIDTATNVDFANIRIITDSFYQRGLISPALPKFSIGMSDGGFFSTALSSIYHFKASVNYCSQGGDYTIQNTTTPIQFCMARFDSNPQVGMQGNAKAFANSNALNARGVCSKYRVKERSPIYPERFARSGSVADSLAVSVFNELKSKGFLDSKNYFMGYASDFMDAYQNAPSDFPAFNNLTISQKLFVIAQISLSVSDHRMYSDFDAATLAFLNNPCQ